MKNITRNIIGILGIILCFLRCDTSLEEISSLTKLEELIVNEWQYKELYINETQIFHVGHGFQPYTKVVTNGWIPYLWFEYNSDKTYEFRSDSRRVSLGKGVNYQSNYGYWDVNESLNLLIHNKGLPYEKHYNIIDINDTLFIREYVMIIQESNDTTLVAIGDTVAYREVFEKRKGPCCDFVDD